MRISRLLLPAALFVAAGPLAGQVVYQPLAISNADALAEQMRRLGTNPLDLEALLTAGELSLRLDDINAAGAFFSRAERIDPRNARAKAGEGALLVRAERPGEALRLFAQAESMGLPPTRFAADRGLAYDLIGDQARAQRDYKLALEAHPDDETRRRYALSLAISGKQAQALDLLAPLIRQNDRAAWRSRAFILAMSGDNKEASRIAQTMMPPGSAAGLQGFFAELPRLPAIDRAFAVHFGEVHPTSARLADARLAPALAPLPAEVAPVQVAAITPRDDRSRKRKKDKGAPVVLAAAPPPVEIMPQAPAFQPPAYQPRADARTAFVSPADRPLSAGELASLNAAGGRSPARAAARPPLAPTPGFSSFAAPRALSATEQANRAVATLVPRPVTRAEVAVVSPTPTVAAPVASATPSAVGRTPMPAEGATALVRSNDAVVAALPSAPVLSPVAPPLAAALPATAPISPAISSIIAAAPLPVPLAKAPIITTVMADSPPAPAAIVTIDAESPPAPISSVPTEVAIVLPAPVIVAPTPAPALPRVASMRAARPPRLGRSQADSLLARIVANLAIPAAELGVDAPGGRPRTAAERRHAARTADRELAAEPVADKPTATDRKLFATKKAAVEKKAQADRETADARKASRAEPGRIWVQVAGGANEGDLDKAWSSVRKKAPTALAGKQAWTTPLRATNRVLTGPFKTDAEARAYVNSLAKNGVSAFTFTSEAGQKVSRLPAK